VVAGLSGPPRRRATEVAVTVVLFLALVAFAAAAIGLH
jgi:hypothetical protein